MARPIGTLGTVDTLTIGGAVFADLSNLIVLWCLASSGAANSTFVKSNGTSGYTPSGSLRFQLGAIVNQNSSIATTTGDYFTIAQSDNDLGSSGSASALTNPVYLSGNASFWLNLSTDRDLQSRQFIHHPRFIINNGKFLSVAGTMTTGRIIFTGYGYEIT